MGNIDINSDIRLNNNDRLSLILDGSIPGLVLYPTNNNSEHLVDSIKDCLSRKGFYVKCYNQNECDFSRITDFVSDNPLLVVILDGLNPNIVFAYGYFKANGRSIFPIFNNRDLEKKEDNENLFEFDEYVSFDLSNTSSDELNSGLMNVLAGYLENNSEKIVSDYADLVIMDTDLDDDALIKEVGKLLNEIVSMHIGKEATELEKVNSIYNRIRDLEQQHGISFPEKGYSLLPFIYLHLFEKGNLSTLELKKSIKNVKELSEQLYVTDSNDLDILLLNKRLADAYTIISIYDERAENCRTSIEYLQNLLEKFESQKVSLYGAKLLNNLGINHLLIEDSTGDTEELELSIHYFEKSLEKSSEKQFPLEFGKIIKNLGISLYRKAIIHNDEKLFERALDCIIKHSSIYIPDIFPEEYYESIIVKANCMSELAVIENDTSALEEAISLYHEALEFFSSDKYLFDHARIIKEMGNTWSTCYRISGDEEYFGKSERCYKDAINIFTLSEHPFQYAATITQLAYLYSLKSDEKDSELIEQSITLLEEAHSLIKINDNPSAYGMIQDMLGDAYSDYANFKGDEESYLRAIDSYEQAARVYTREYYPHRYSQLRRKIAGSLSALASAVNNEKYYEDAIRSYYEYLEVYDPEEDPAVYISTYNNIGQIYRLTVRDDTDQNTIKKMAGAYNSALEIAEKKELTDEIITTRYNLGNSYFLLGKATQNSELLREAARNFEQALELTGSLDEDEFYGVLNLQLGECLYKLYELNGETEHLIDSAGHLSSSLSFYEFEKYPEQYGKTNKTLGDCYSMMSLKLEDLRIQDAISSYENSARYYTAEDFPLEYYNIYKNVGDLYTLSSTNTLIKDPVTKSIESYQKSLGVISGDEYEKEHAIILNNIGNQFRELADTEDRLDNCNHAINYFNRALDLLDPESEGLEYRTVLNNLGAAYNTLADCTEIGENSEKAVEYLESALDDVDVETYPELYASLNNNLGNAYQLLSRCKDIDSETILGCYDNSLEIYGNTDKSVDYAVVRSNLGEAYCALDDELTSGNNARKAIQFLEDSIEILEKCNNNKFLPVVKNNLGNAYLKMADREQAVENCGKAIKFFDSVTVALNGANEYIKSVLNNNLGTVYHRLSEEINSYENEAKAIEHYEKAREYYAEQGDLNFCAITRANYATALKTHSKTGNHADYPEKILSLYGCSLGYYSQKYFPIEYASIKYGLGRILYETGIENSDTKVLKDSIRNYNDSLNIYSKENAPHYYATLCYAIGSSLLALGHHENHEENCDQALNYLGESREILDCVNFPKQYAFCRLKEGEIYDFLSGRNGNEEMYLKALNSYKDSLNYFTKENDPRQNRHIHARINDLFNTISSHAFSTDDPLKSIDYLSDLTQLFPQEVFPGEYAIIRREIAGRYVELSKTGEPVKHLMAASECYRDLITYARQNGEREELALLHQKLGDCLRDLGENQHDMDNLEDAAVSFKQALDFFAGRGNDDTVRALSLNLAECNRIMSGLKSGQNDIEGAVECLQSASEIYKKYNNTAKQHELDYEKGRLLKIQAQEKNDLDKFMESAVIFKSLLNDSESSYVRGKTGGIYENLGDIYRAVAGINGSEDDLRNSAENYIKSLEITSTEGSTERTVELNRKTGEIHGVLGDSRYEESDFENALPYYLNAVKYLDKQVYPKSYTEIQRKIVDSYKSLGSLMQDDDTGSAIEFYESALEISRQGSDALKTAEIQKVLGSIYKDESEAADEPERMKHAIGNLRESLEVFETGSHPELYGEVSFSLCECYRWLAGHENREENLENAVYHLEQAALYYTRDEFPEQYSKICSSAVAVYTELGDIRSAGNDTETALEYYRKALGYCSSEKMPREYGILNYSSGLNIYKMAVNSNEAERLEQAGNYLKEASDYFSGENDNEYLANISAMMGDIDFKKFQITSDENYAFSSVENYEKFIAIAGWDTAETRVRENYLTILKSAADILCEQNRPEDSLEYLDKYQRFCGSADILPEIEEKVAGISLSIFRDNGDTGYLDTAEQKYVTLLDSYTEDKNPEKYGNINYNLSEIYNERLDPDQDDLKIVEKLLICAEDCLRIYRSGERDSEREKIKEYLENVWSVLKNNYSRDFDTSANYMTRVANILTGLYDEERSAALELEIADIYYEQADSTGIKEFYVQAVNQYSNYLQNINVSSDHEQFTEICNRITGICIKLSEDPGYADYITFGINRLSECRKSKTGKDTEIDNNIDRLYTIAVDKYRLDGDIRKVEQFLANAVNEFEDNKDIKDKYSVELATYLREIADLDETSGNISEAIEYNSTLLENDIENHELRSRLNVNLGDLYFVRYNNDQNEITLQRSLGYYNESLEFYSNSGDGTATARIAERVEQIRQKLAELGSFENTESAIEYYIKQIELTDTEQDPQKAAVLNSRVGDLYIQKYEEESDGSDLHKAIHFYSAGSGFYKKRDNTEGAHEIALKLRDTYQKVLQVTDEDDSNARVKLLESVHDLGVIDDNDSFAEVCRQLGDLKYKLGSESNDADIFNQACGYYEQSLKNFSSDKEDETTSGIKLNICRIYGQDCEIADEERLNTVRKYCDDIIDFFNSEGSSEQLDEARSIKTSILLRLTDIVDDDRKLGIYHESLDSDLLDKKDDLKADIQTRTADIYYERFKDSGDNTSLEQSINNFISASEYYKEHGPEERYEYTESKIRELRKVSLEISDDDDIQTVLRKLEELSKVCENEGDINGYFITQLKLAATYMDTGFNESDSGSLYKAQSIYDNLLSDERIEPDKKQLSVIKRNNAKIKRSISEDSDRELLSDSLLLNIESLNLFPADDQSGLELLKNDIAEEVVILFNLDLMSEELPRASTVYWDNIQKLGGHLGGNELAGIHIAVSNNVYENIDDLQYTDVIAFLERIKTELDNIDPDSDTTAITCILYDCYQNSASSFFDSGNYLDSVQYFTKAKNLVAGDNDREKDFEVHYGLGSVYRALWKAEGGETNLKKAIKYFENSVHSLDSGNEDKNAEIENTLYELKTDYTDLLISEGEYQQVDSLFEELLGVYNKDKDSNKYHSLIKARADLYFSNKETFSDQQGAQQIIDLYHDALEFYTAETHPEENNIITQRLEELEGITSTGNDTEFIDPGIDSGQDENYSISQDEDFPPGQTSEDVDHKELVTQYETILQKLKVEDSPVNYADTCVKIGRSYSQLAKKSNDLKKYEAAVKSFQNALNVFEFTEYPEKNAAINREIGEIYKLQAEQTNDPKLYRQMTGYYDDALKYYKYDQFPKENASLLKDIAYAESSIAELTGDIEGYRRSVDMNQKALKFFNRENSPDQYARINENLGVAYSILSEYESGNDLIKSSIESFNTALGVYESSGDKSSIASVSKYLGIAYNSLSEKEGNIEYLRKSAKNYQKSANLSSELGDTKDFCFVSKSLAAVYTNLSEKENASDNIKKAIKSYEDSLGYYTFENSPQEFASINNHMGSLYTRLSEIEMQSENCFNSIKCFEQVLRVYNKNDNPMEYGATHNNLGVAYRNLAEVEDKIANCKKSIESYRKAIQIYNLRDFPVQYSSTQSNIGGAYRTLAEEENRVENCKKAIKAYQEALKVRKLQEMPVQFAATQNNLGVSYRTLAEEEDKARNCMQAIKAYESALIVYSLEKFPVQYATTKNNVAGAYTTLAEDREKIKNCNLAIQCYREAQSVFNKENFEEINGMIEEGIQYLEKMKEQ